MLQQKLNIEAFPRFLVQFCRAAIFCHLTVHSKTHLVKSFCCHRKAPSSQSTVV